MKFAKAVLMVVVLCSVGAVVGRPQTNAKQEVVALLNEFMAGAGTSDKAVFDKFFADDLIYTRATGVVITKASIMEGLGKPASASEGKVSYSAEEITVHEYGDTVIVAFRLVGRTERAEGKVETILNRNTGVFLRRNGKWQAVAWQSTKISEPAKPQ